MVPEWNGYLPKQQKNLTSYFSYADRHIVSNKMASLFRRKDDAPTPTSPPLILMQLIASAISQGEYITIIPWARVGYEVIK